MAVADLRTRFYGAPQVDTSWLGNLLNNVGGAIDQAGDQKLVRQALGSQGQPQAPGMPSSIAPTSSRAASSPQAYTAPVTAVARGPAQGDTYQPFIDTVKTRVTNPYGLAAVAATGRAESGWSGNNANRTWSDPSQSGQGGTAGGVMSWRADRLANLQKFAASKGEQGNGSPQTQAEFFLNEDPQLIDRLNQAKSPTEAADIIAGSWKFAGYDQQGGEAARRRALAQNYFSNEFSGMPMEQGDTSAVAGYVDPMVSAPNSRSSGLRPFQPGERRNNSDGSYSTEISTTWQLPDGSWANIPSLWMGPNGPQQFNADDEDGILSAAMQYESQNGPTFQRYRSAQEAETAARQRSSAGGAGAGQQMPPRGGGQGSNVIAQGVTPIARGGFDPEVLSRLISNPRLRELGVAMWKQNAGQSQGEPWQFVTLPDGTLARANQQTGAIENVGNFAKPASADLPSSYKEYQLAKQDGFKGGYADWEKVKQPGVTVNTGDTTGSGDFYKEADKLRAKATVDQSNAGLDAQRRLVQVDQLDGLLKTFETGGLAEAKRIAGEWGVNTEGLDDIQAATALINQMVPAQRPPGSGTMSDADLALFKQSLPRIIGQPGGNELIIGTMREIATYDMKMAEIADQVLNRRISPEEGSKQQRALANPLSEFREKASGFRGTPEQGRASRPQTEDDFKKLPSGSLYIDPDDGQTYRKR